MKVLVFEDNLMWSARLRQTLTAHGHEPEVRSRPVGPYEADAAVVNLGAPEVTELIRALQAAATPVIGHAGHKETALRELGKQLGVDILASNSELTHKLPELLERLPKH